MYLPKLFHIGGKLRIVGQTRPASAKHGVVWQSCGRSSGTCCVRKRKWKCASCRGKVHGSRDARLALRFESARSSRLEKAQVQDLHNLVTREARSKEGAKRVTMIARKEKSDLSVGNKTRPFMCCQTESENSDCSFERKPEGDCRGANASNRPRWNKWCSSKKLCAIVSLLLWVLDARADFGTQRMRAEALVHPFPVLF